LKDNSISGGEKEILDCMGEGWGSWFVF